MTTTWVSMTRFEPRSWLLANGEIVEEPPLEQTSSGRKVRVKGSSDSFYSKDLEDLLRVSAEGIAADKGTTVFLPLHGQADVERRPIEGIGAAKLHLNEAEKKGMTTCWWKFRHPSMPYSILVVATLAQDYYCNQTLSVRLYQPRPFGHFGTPTYSEASYDAIGVVTQGYHGVYPGSKQEEWSEFYRDNPLEWATSVLDTPDHQYSVARQGAEALLKIVHEMEDLDTVSWFDFSGDVPAYADLDLYDSNVNNQFVSDLTEYLDASPSVDKAIELYDQLMTTLKSCGFVVEKRDNDFNRALNGGTLSFKVENLPSENNEKDYEHVVVVNVLTGTMIVECTARGVNHNTIAEQWEEAKTVATLTGQEDELLEYARLYAEKAAEKRTKIILKERGA